MKCHCIGCESSRDAVVVAEGSWSRRGSAGAQWPYVLARCPECGHGQVHPSPEPEVLAEWYAGDYHTYRTIESGFLAAVARRAKLAVGQAAAARHRSPTLARTAVAGIAGWIERVAARTVPLTTSFPLSLPRTAAILDYGCGSGWWLLELKRLGYSNLHAFDVEQPALRAVRSAGIPVTIRPDPLPRGMFECVRLEHVLEHLVDPGVVLRDLRETLAGAGSVVLTVPNYGSWSARVAGREYAALDLPRHLHHFTERSLRAVAVNAGFKVAEVLHLPIWEVGSAAVAVAGAVDRGGPPALGTRPWRARYHAWAKRQHEGDYISVRLVAA